MRMAPLQMTSPEGQRQEPDWMFSDMFGCLIASCWVFGDDVKGLAFYISLLVHVAVVHRIFSDHCIIAEEGLLEVCSEP